MQNINRSPITVVDIGQTTYLDIRAIGAGWYQGLYLPNSDFSIYVIPLEYRSWQDSAHTRLNCVIPSLKIQWTGRNAVNHSFVKMWGSQVSLSDKMTLITLEFIKQYKLIEKLA